MERIRDALEYDRFEIFAQPILDLHSNEVTQHELLIRMRGAEGELGGYWLGFSRALARAPAAARADDQQRAHAR